MPADEQGVKWACQPCIRGHRSTKCQHWDRFMLKVKKPGRPLSSCPHSSGSCTCFRHAVMMMRVMKGSTCFCAPQPGSFQNLEAPPTAQQNHPGPTRQDELSRLEARQPPTFSAVNGFPTTKEVANGSNGVAMNPHAMVAPKPSVNDVSKRTTSGCCKSEKQETGSELERHQDTGKTGQQDASQVTQGQTSIGRSQAGPSSSSIRRATDGELSDIKRRRNGDIIENSTGKSCCKGDRHQSLSSIQPSPANVQNDPRYQGAIWQQNPNLSHSGLPNINKAQPGYGHNYMPIRPAVQHQITPQMLPYNLDMQSASQGYGVSYIPTTQAMVSPIYSVGPNWQHVDFASPQNQACRCGTDCECFGCPVHPYNETTRREVQELTTIIETDMAADFAAQTLPTPNNELNGIDLGSDPISSPDYMNGGTFPISSDSQFSRPPSSGLISSHMQVPDYSTFQFDFSHCGGSAGTCMCDDDCDCPGCVTHKNPPFPGQYSDLNLAALGFTIDDQSANALLGLPNFPITDMSSGDQDNNPSQQVADLRAYPGHSENGSYSLPKTKSSI